jgi:ketopantoate reductase
MKIAIVGAGAIGGYLGARLALPARRSPASPATATSPAIQANG